MNFPIQYGDHGPDVAAVQDRLNRLGMLLVCDGNYGHGTEWAVSRACDDLGITAQNTVDDALWTKLDALPQPCPALPTEGVEFIVQAEVTSRHNYEAVLCHPTWPSAESGITIGIGYDLQFSTPSQFADDWQSHMSAADFTALQACLGKKGSKDILQAVRLTNQAYAGAWACFCRHTIPQTIQQTRSTFPGYDGLPGLCQSALVSLVYNRGSSLVGDSRREMKAIHDLIIAGNLAAVPEQFRSQTRLWPTLPGLQTRRLGEANLWDRGLSQGNTKPAA